MYEKFYGFVDKPFTLIPDPKYLFLESCHKEALDFLTHSMDHNARSITMTGEIGAGKTVVLRSFMKNLGPDFHVVQVSYPFGDTGQLLNMILKEEACACPAKESHELYEELIVRLTALRLSGKRPLLVIDEAQHLERDTLRDILDLSERKEDGAYLVQVVLCGQRILKETLGSLETPSSENCSYYHLRALPEKDVPRYIKFRLSAAGCRDQDIFAEEVMSEISRLSGGTPRLINTLCDALLVQGYLQNRRKITVSVMKDVPVSLSFNPLPVSPGASDGTGISCVQEENPPLSSDTGQESVSNELCARVWKSAKEAAQAYEGYGGQGIEDAFDLRVIVFEKNARMRMHMENHLATLGHSLVITDDIETVFSTLEGREKWELYVLVADAAFFFAPGGKETPAGMRALDAIQTACPEIQIIMTSVLPLTALRWTLFHRGIFILLQKPDMQQLAPSLIEGHLNAFFHELHSSLRTTRSQFSAFYSRIVKLTRENADTDSNVISHISRERKDLCEEN